MKWLAVGILAALLAACTASLPPTPSMISPTATLVPTLQPTPSPTQIAIVPTWTAQPSYTPAATYTPLPTNTPYPTATPYPSSTSRPPQSTYTPLPTSTPYPTAPMYPSSTPRPLPTVTMPPQISGHLQRAHPLAQIINGLTTVSWAEYRCFEMNFYTIFDGHTFWLHDDQDGYTICVGVGHAGARRKFVNEADLKEAS